jgi:hypothetical protein
MHPFPLFAEIPPFDLRPESIVVFFFSTTVFLVLCGGVVRWSRSPASKLIGLGILVAVVSVAYGGLVVSPTVMTLSSGLMKIAIILVLGGVACSVLAALAGLPAPEMAKSKEPGNDR